jgi:cytochrome c oxidase subunit II
VRTFWTLLFLLVPLFGVVAFIGSAATAHAWLPENISSAGEGIDHLFNLILAITGVVFVATEVLLAVAMFRARGQNHGKSTYTHGNRTMEIAWTVFTALILLFVAFYQMPAWKASKYQSQKPKTEPDALITASQFLWEVRYPMWDEKAGQLRKLNSMTPVLGESFQTVNELHVAPNEPVLIHLTTRDVIHSFWLPNCRVKQDTLPGHIIPVWFDAKNDSAKRKEYEWVCAELCGWGHFRMRARFVVHPSKEDYLEWVKEKTKEQVAGAKAN